jgi:hypothetical protein
MINPSAWMVGNNLCRRLEQAQMHHEFSGDPIVPLYPAKTLTDEEIKSESKYFCHTWHSENPERLVLFARAILRKAQEK